MVKSSKHIEIKGDESVAHQELLTDEALDFLQQLHQQFDRTRRDLLKKREEVQHALNEGVNPKFLDSTREIREDLSWKVAETPQDLLRRRVELTGPTERKMLINALNSGADIFMADFEDANSPFWKNMIEGQINLRDAVNETLTFVSPEGKKYALNKEHAVLLVRPRGWHLNEKHLLIDGEEIAGAFFDFGLYFFHNAKKLIEKGTAPYFYLPKIENHLEARLWNDLFVFAQKALGIPQGTIRATVLIETILAVFEMEEILFELRDHSSGLNAGRWDYIFSIIKKFCRRKFIFPNREKITMTTPFMRAYTELLVKTCHKRGAHAMGGMAAFIPNRRDLGVTEKALAKVREDKLREAEDGFDGTWVAHPDLVYIAQEIFDARLGMDLNQRERLREEVDVKAEQLLNFSIEGAAVNEEGVRHNINVALQYFASWLRGIGAAAIYNLMEDAATAEISRAQIWQWITHGAKLSDGRLVTTEMVRTMIGEELEKIASEYQQLFDEENFGQAQKLLECVVFSEQFIPFATLLAYKELP